MYMALILIIIVFVAEPLGTFIARRFPMVKCDSDKYQSKKYL